MLQTFLTFISETTPSPYPYFVIMVLWDFQETKMIRLLQKGHFDKTGTVDKFCISSLGSASIKSFYNPIALSEQHLVLFRSWLQIYICNCFMTTTTTFPIRCNENHVIVMQISGRFANKTNAITALKRNLLLLWEKVCYCLCRLVFIVE